MWLHQVGMEFTVQQETRSQSAETRGTTTLGTCHPPVCRSVSEAINRKIRKAGISVHTHLTNTIRSMLVSPKDRPKTVDRTGTIYNIRCLQHHNTSVRLRGHLAGDWANTNGRASPVGAHMKGAKHTFVQEDVKILDTDARWFQRGVKGSIYIATHQPDLNRDSGRHHLPNTYKKLIESCDLSSRSRSRDSTSANKISHNTHCCSADEVILR